MRCLQLAEEKAERKQRKDFAGEEKNLPMPRWHQCCLLLPYAFCVSFFCPTVLHRCHGKSTGMGKSNSKRESKKATGAGAGRDGTRQAGAALLATAPRRSADGRAQERDAREAALRAPDTASGDEQPMDERADGKGEPAEISGEDHSGEEQIDSAGSAQVPRSPPPTASTRHDLRGTGSHRAALAEAA